MMRSGTKKLLTAGTPAGPVFTPSWLVAGATREGHDPLRRPVSALAIGTMGWTQITTFLTVGVLLSCLSIALMRNADRESAGRIALGREDYRVLRHRAHRRRAIHVRSPERVPNGLHTLRAERSITGMLHDAFSAFLFLGYPFAAYEYGRIFMKRKSPGWAVYTMTSGFAFIGFLILTSSGFGRTAGFVELGGLFQRITLTILWCLMTAVAIRFRSSVQAGDFAKPAQ